MEGEENQNWVDVLGEWWSIEKVMEDFTQELTAVINQVTVDGLDWELEVAQVEKELEEEFAKAESLINEEWQEAWDDVNGGELKIEDVRKGRSEEIGCMKGRRIWSVKDTGECWERTGRKPVSVKWVDTDKGSAGKVEVRCRLVARDFKVKGEKDREDLFAATPPLEGKRWLFSRAVTRGRGVRKILLIDARKAHLNPKCTEDVYIELPPEAGEGAGRCGKLNYWLYGFRPAAQAWEDLYSERLESVGFVRGVFPPWCFIIRNGMWLVWCMEMILFLRVVVRIWNGWRVKLRSCLG